MVSWMTDPLFRPDLDALCDFSNAQSTPTMSDLRELIGFLSRNAEFVGSPRLAIVASKAITFVVANEFASLAKQVPMEVRVFANRETALAWLRPDEDAM